VQLGEIAGWLALIAALGLGLLVAGQMTKTGRIERQFRVLMKGSGSPVQDLSLGQMIVSQGERVDAMRARLDDIEGTLRAMEKPMTHSIQCVGLVRFNPFGDTGGDQSFALALLDKHGDGVVVSSLHGRAATRFYAKPVRAGSSQISLSEEEIQAIQQAMNK
jgi:hypothetical protein